MTLPPAESALPSNAVLPVVWKLLRLRWQIIFNGFRRARTVRKIFTVIGLLALLGLIGGIFWLSWKALGFLQSPELAQYVGDITQFTQAIPGLIFAGFFVSILLTSFGVLLQALYLSGDMDFLLAAPVPIRAVFISKLLQAVLPNFSLGAVLTLPVLYGLGAVNGYNFLYYPLALIMMAVLSLTAAGISGLLVMLVVRIFPARRVVEVLGFFGAIFSIICSQSGNLMNSASDDVNVSQEQVSSALNLLTQLNNPLNPLNWPGRGLLALGAGDWLSGLGLTLLSLGLASALFWISLETAERWYYTGWAGMQVVARKKKTAAPARPGREFPLVAGMKALAVRLVSAPIRGLVWKDALVLRRDLRHLSQLVTPLIFGIIYGFMFLRSGGEPPPGQGDAPQWFMDTFRTALSFGNIALSIFVGWMLLQRLGGMGFSSEGKNYWMLKAAPISARQMLTAKFLVAYVPALALSLVFLLGFSLLQGVALGAAAYSLLVMVLCLAGMAGILVAFGAAGANFTWEDPRKMSAGSLGCVGALLTLLFVPVDLVFFLGPLVLADVLGLPLAYGYLAGTVLGAGLSLLCAILPLRLMETRVEHLGESS